MGFAKQGTANRYVYLIVSADEYELPCFISKSAAETAKFLGITTNMLYRNAFRSSETIGKPRGRYRLVRMLEVKEDDNNTREAGRK
jgi:hypothetical protein